jgi:hypothetical protein
MSDPHTEGQPPLEPPLASGEQVHEYVVERIPDLDLSGPIVFETGGGSDTGLRQIFPVTYDIPLDRPDAVQTAEDD